MVYIVYNRIMIKYMCIYSVCVYIVYFIIDFFVVMKRNIYEINEEIEYI